MPALVLFRRRYRIASDDLHLPALYLAGLRLFDAAVVLLYLIQVEAKSHHSCRVRHGFALLLGCVAVVGIGGAVGAFMIAIDAARGLVLERDARRTAQKLLKVGLVCFPIELVLGALCVWVAWWGGSTTCRREDGDLVLLRVAATLTAMQYVATLVCAVVLLDARGGKAKTRAPLRRGALLEVPLRDVSADDRKNLANLCQCACRVLSIGACGFLGSAPQDDHAKHHAGDARNHTPRHQRLNAHAALWEVAELWSDWCGALDAVPSDLVAGMALVRARQKQDARTWPHRSRVHEKAEKLEPTDPTLERLQYFATYAFAVYGAAMAFARDPRRGLVSCGRGLNPCYQGDADFAALNYDSRDATVLFHDEEAAPNQRVPVAVMDDASRGCVIIACRGTMSLEDCLSDATCADTSLAEFDAKLSGRAHAGMASIASNTLRLVLPHLDKTEGPIVCVGHSLGGGVAQLLALFLTSSRPDREVTCVAYEPPGAVVDPTTADAMDGFCLSSVLADDLVPRAGVPQLFQLRDACVDGLCKSKVPKWRVLASLAARFPICENLLYSVEDAAFPEAHSLSEACSKLLTDEAREDLRAPQVLCVPGRIIHFVRDKQRKRDVSAFAAPRDHFNHIVVSSTIMADHFPWRVERAISDAMYWGQIYPWRAEPTVVRASEDI
jgi:pimeloyl-ACP methyl ester carboxylesterase